MVTTSELAEIFGVTKAAVHSWMRAGMPVGKHGLRGAGNEALIDLKEAAAWYFKRNYERLALDRERTKLAREQARKIELENQARLAGLGELEIWREELDRFFGEIRASLQPFPENVAPLLIGDVNQRKTCLEDAVHGLLRKLAAHG